MKLVSIWPLTAEFAKAGCFKGTRILVSDALELSKAGYSPEAIARQYRGIITAKGVREALALTRRGIVREIATRAKTAA